MDKKKYLFLLHIFMARQSRQRSAAKVYHVMMRGINRQQIFWDLLDYQKFLKTLQDLPLRDQQEGELVGPLFKVYAYCLMGNHVHLLIQEGSESIGDSIKRIASSYAGYYNHRYERVGHLFQDRFKSEPVNDRDYFITLLRYIHQNPVKGGVCRHVSDYEWSSWQEYLGKSSFHICKISATLKMIPFRELKSLMDEECMAECMDMDNACFKLTDGEAWDRICLESGCETIADFQTLDGNDQFRFALQACKNGVAVRQASRLTGLSIYKLRYKLKKVS